MKVILAEKPSVARDIAQVIGAKARKDGYFEGSGYQVTWAFGHLVGLADPKAYGFQRWSLQELPIIPAQFKFEVSGNQGVKKQFNIIKGLINNADRVICATDAGREGEHIFRLIYKQAKCDKPFDRLWISSLTNEAIQKGMNNLIPGSEKDNLAAAAGCRSVADWLVGINATRALTLATKSKTPISVGRVQSPTLALICERFVANRDFKPTDFFVPKLILEKDELQFTAEYEGDRFDEQTACQAILDGIQDKIECTSAESKSKKEKQPLLYDLTTLQADANQVLGFGTDQTLTIAQGLYEKHKVLTYPRTDSRYLSNDIYKTLPGLFQKVANIGNYGQFIQSIDLKKLPKVSVNDKKVSDHHAIIPTGQMPNGLTLDEKKLFDMVTRRFIAAFSPECIKDVTTYLFAQDKHAFKAQGTVIQEPGWRTVDPMKSDKADGNESMPAVEQGELVKVHEKVNHKGTTKAPELYTQGRLVKVMESAGKEVDDEELKEALKERGLGTPATRAETIKKLFSRGFIEEQKKKLFPTELGLRVYELIKHRPIGKPDLTGDWEMRLKQIEEGQTDARTFLEDIKGYTRKITAELSQAKMKIPPKVIGKCPKCKDGNLLAGEKGYGCANVSAQSEVECDFIVWKVINGHYVEEDEVLDLVKKGYSKKVKSYPGKDGKPFKAILKLDDEFKVRFASPDYKPRVEIGTCPKCKEGQIIEGKKGFGCSRFNPKDKTAGCDFVIWKELHGKKLSANQVTDLVLKGKTRPVKGFKRKNGDKVDKAFVLVLNQETFKIDFEERK